MIHQNHLPLDQRREQARWKCVAIGGSRPNMIYPSCLRSSDPQRVVSAICDPRDAQHSCIVPHDPHLAAGAIQTVRALPSQQQRSHLSCQLAKEVLGFVKQRHTRDYCERITRPICTLCLPIPTPDLDTPSSLKSYRFPYRKIRPIKGVEACKKTSMKNRTISVSTLWVYQGSVLPKIVLFRRCRQFGVQIIDASAHDLPLMPSRTPLPARYPPIGTWPALMRADMAAAYLDYRNTAEFARAVMRGEAPSPTGYHGTGRTREPVWSKAVIDNITGPARALDLDRSEGKDLSSLV